MSVTCYVYYRVAPDRVPEAARAARETIERMRRCTGVSGRLMTRVGEPLLWMEVYEDIADQAAFLDAMRDCVEHSAINGCLDGDRGRHTEIFQPAGARQPSSPDSVS